MNTGALRVSRISDGIDSLLLGIAAQRGSGCDLTDKSGGRHLAAGHPIDSVVDKEDCQLLPVGCLNGLIQADRGQISVP